LLIVHSKFSSTILILGPILLIFIVSMGLSDPGLKNINANVYVSDRSSFTEAFVDNLRARSFIVEESGSLEECVNEVRNTGKNVCIQLKKYDVDIPDKFNLTDEEVDKSGMGYSVHLHTDFSRQRVAWGVINSVQIAINDFASNIRSSLSSKLKIAIGEYRGDIRERRQEIKEIIDILDEIEQGVSQTKVVLKSDLDNIDSLMDDLEARMDRLNRENSSIINQYGLGIFWQLSSAWQSSYYMGDVNKLYSDLEGFEQDLRDARNDLQKTYDDLGELERGLESIGSINMDYLLNPIPLSYESLSGDVTGEFKVELGFLDYLFPSFLSFFILLVSVIFSSNFIMKERTGNAYIRNVLSKTSTFTFLLGNFLSVLLIVLVQCFIILVIADFFFNVLLITNFFSLLVIILLAGSIFISLGMLIAYIFGSQETAVIATVSLSLLLIIFSPLVSPLETLPDFLRMILTYSPLVLIEDLFKRILIFETGLGPNVHKLIVLATYFLTLFVTTLFINEITKHREIK